MDDNLRSITVANLPVCLQYNPVLHVYDINCNVFFKHNMYWNPHSSPFHPLSFPRSLYTSLDLPSSLPPIQFYSTLHVHYMYCTCRALLPLLPYPFFLPIFLLQLLYSSVLLPHQNYYKYPTHPDLSPVIYPCYMYCTAPTLLLLLPTLSVLLLPLLHLP